MRPWIMRRHASSFVERCGSRASRSVRLLARRLRPGGQGSDADDTAIMTVELLRHGQLNRARPEHGVPCLDS
jgi:hypothetical protein